MRGLGAFQMAQMKHCDARVFALCQHLRSAIDIFEQIVAEPFQPPERPTDTHVATPPPPVPELPSEKLTYTVKDACEALGVGRSTVWKAVTDGRLAAIKLGKRTLIPAAAMRAWLSSLPSVKRTG